MTGGVTVGDLLNTLRVDGWAVAVHNDYMLYGKRMTFWLFTRADSGADVPLGRDGVYIKGEGETDFLALVECVKKARLL